MDPELAARLAAQRAKIAVADGEVAALLATAERLVLEEQGQAALDMASKALEMYRSAREAKGRVDAMYQVILAKCLLNRREEAVQNVQDELAQSQTAGDRYCEAKMLLSFAWVNGRAGDAPRWTKRAEEIFRDLGDKKNEALALLVDVNVSLQRRDQDPHMISRKLSEVLSKANGALLLSRGIGDKVGEAYALHWLACAQVFNGFLAEAVETSEAAAEMYHELGLEMMEANALKQAASWELQFRGMLDDEDKALKLAEKSLEIIRSHSFADSKKEVKVLGIVVRSYIARDRLQDGMEIAKKGMQRFKDLKDRKSEAETLLMLMQCNMAKEMEKSDEALKQAQQALVTFKELGDERSEATVAGLIALLHLKRAENSKAKAMAEKCISFQKALGLMDKGVALHVLVGVHLADQKFEEALKYANMVQEMCREEGQVVREGIALLTMCNVYFQMEDYQKALAAAREAEALFFEEEAKKWEAEAHQFQSEVHQARQEHLAAVRCAEKAYAGFRALGDAQGMAYVLVLAAQNQVLLLAKKEKPDEADGPNSYSFEMKVGSRKAMLMAQEAQELSRRLDNKSGLASALAAGAQILVFDKKFNEALDATDAASKIYRELGEAKLLANTLVLGANIRLAAGLIDEGLEYAMGALTLFQRVGDRKGEMLAQVIIDKLQEEGADLTIRKSRPTAPAAEPAEIAAPKSEDKEAVAKPSGLNERDVALAVDKVTKGMVGGKSVDWNAPLMEAGITSLNAVVYRHKLMDQFEGIRLPVTLVFDYPTVEAISDLILEQGKKLGGASAFG